MNKTIAMEKFALQFTDNPLFFKEAVGTLQKGTLSRTVTENRIFLIALGEWENDNKAHIIAGSGRFRPHDPPLPEQSFVHDRVPGGEVCLTCEDIEIQALLSSGGGSRYYSLGWYQDIANCQSCDICRLLASAFADEIGQTNFPSSFKSEKTFVVLDTPRTVAPFPTSRRDRPIELRGLLIGATSWNLYATACIRPAAASTTLLGKNQMFSSRTINMAIADLTLARTWINECCSSHTAIESRSDRNHLHNAALDTDRLSETAKTVIAEYRDRENSWTLLRLVDVEDECLSLRPRREKYIALSYVWPQFDTLRLTKSNSKALHSHGSLTKFQSKLSKVIRDAMTITCGLGQRYLWVDALCITQDDEAEKQELIGRMDLVYGNSLVTLVVASQTPSTCDYGIPGVGDKPRTSRQHVAEVENVRLLTALPNLSRSIKDSVWCTRGWTFQEQLLSPRCLIFADQQMFFRCPHDCRAEDVHAEGCGDFMKHPAKPGPKEERIQYLIEPELFEHISKDRTFHVYAQIVRVYTKRKFTNPDDILPAFMGIVMAMLEHLPYPQGFFAGLPIHAFDRALLWYPIDRLERRNPIIKADQTSIQLPSWSWVGWKGSVDYEKGRDNIGDFDAQKPMVLWWRWEDHHLKSIKDHSRYMTKDLEFSWCMLVARARGMEITQLIFWGTCVELSVGVTESNITGWTFETHRALPCFALLDDDGDPCGMLPATDHQWAERHTRGISASKYQFLLLAYIQQSTLDEVTERSRWLHPKYVVHKPSADGSMVICFYSIMLIEFDEKGIAYRRGIGRVHKDAVDRHLEDFRPKIMILG